MPVDGYSDRRLASGLNKAQTGPLVVAGARGFERLTIRVNEGLHTASPCVFAARAAEVSQEYRRTQFGSVGSLDLELTALKLPVCPAIHTGGPSTETQIPP